MLIDIKMKKIVNRIRSILAKLTSTLAFKSIQISENIRQTISHELPSGFCRDMCHTDANIEFLM